MVNHQPGRPKACPERSRRAAVPTWPVPAPRCGHRHEL